MELFLEIVIFGYLSGRKESTYFNRQSQSWKRKVERARENQNGTNSSEQPAVFDVFASERRRWLRPPGSAATTTPSEAVPAAAAAAGRSHADATTTTTTGAPK